MRIALAVLVFVLSFAMGVASKFVLRPSWMKEYSTTWSDEIGELKEDIAYGEGEANTFDLYLPCDGSRDSYGLVVYLHAGGFTAGDKIGDRDTLARLCEKGYVAAGINYTLKNETNTASVYTQSLEIKAAVPKVVEAAEQEGYHIDKMAVAGGSAGHALAMIYAYRDGADAPVPVVLTYGAVGPSSFIADDWGLFGCGTESEEARTAAAVLFWAMCGEEINPEEIQDGSYREKVHRIAAAEWVSQNPVPTVVAYGTHDRVQPFAASLRLKEALEESGVDHVFIEMPHSGHGLQNDSALSRQWIEATDAYLEKYLPTGGRTDGDSGQ